MNGMSVLQPYTPKQRYYPAKVKHEENLQRQVCQYISLAYPRVIYRSDFASGLHMTMHQAMIHKSLQSGRAWVDLFIYTPMRHGDKYYAGLGLEIKKSGTAIYVSRGPNKDDIVADPHIREQHLLIEELNRLGFFARFGIGFDNCKRIIDFYLNPNFKEQENAELF